MGLKDPEEIIGKKLYDIFPRKIAKIIEENNNKVMETGESLIIEEPSLDNKKFETYLSHKVPIKKQSVVIGILGISMKITNRKQLEKKLKNEKKEAERKLIEKKIIFSQIQKQATGDYKESCELEDYMSEMREFYENLIALMPGHVYWLNREGVYLGCSYLQAKSAVIEFAL